MAQIKIRTSKTTVSPFTPEDMIQIGKAVMNSVKMRIMKGLDVHEQPAKPLKPTVHIDKSDDKAGQLADLIPYPVQKARRGKKPIRDLVNTGSLMASIQVISASEDTCTIASNNVVKDAILHKNNKRCPQFGLSDSDKAVMGQKVREIMQRKIDAMFRNS